MVPQNPTVVLNFHEDDDIIDGDLILGHQGLKLISATTRAKIQGHGTNSTSEEAATADDRNIIVIIF